MAIGTTIRGLVAVLGLSAIFTSANAAACRGLSGKDKITAVALSPGLSLTRGYQEGLVTWEFPTDVCLYRWLIEMSPLEGGSSNKVSFYEKSEARSASIPINEIKPGVLYRVSITMEFAPDRYGPKESIDTVPITQCSVSGVPGVPVGLYVKDQTSQGYNVAEDYIEVCWASYSDGNAGCPDEYTVALRVQPSGPSGLFEDRHAWRFEKFSTAGCHRVYGIEQGTMYDIGIRAFNVASTSSSDVALIQDYVTDRWQCVKGDFYTNRGDQVTYDWCDAAKNGQCTPMTCDEIASAGMCSHSSVRRYDLETFTVIQYCSSKCGCSVPSDDEIREIPEVQPDGDLWACCRPS